MSKKKKVSPINSISENDKGHLVEIVKMRTDALVSYSNRVWTVFSLFQTLNLAIIGAIFTKQTIGENQVIFLGIISLFLSTIWYILGLNDYRSMEKHKNIKKIVEEKLFVLLNISEVLVQAEKPKHRRVVYGFNQTKTLYIIPFSQIIVALLIILQGMIGQCKCNSYMVPIIS